MAAIIGKLQKAYHTVFTEWGDPRAEDYILMSSPIPGLVLLGFYLYFVQNLGPRLMKNRPPFELKAVMICYNIIQMGLSAYTATKAFQLAWGGQYKWICEPVDFTRDPTAVEILRVTHFYFLTKVTDLLDTIFFVLRKKNTHVSFLHVYHHTGMVMLGWAGTKFMAGGHGTFLGFINSIVHVVMYFHYLLTLLNEDYKNSIWFKKRITQLQILQFLLLVIHFSSLVLTPNCAYPQWIAGVMVPQNLFMLLLFLDFYRKSYITGPKKRTGHNVRVKESLEDYSIPSTSNGKWHDEDVLSQNSCNSNRNSKLKSL